MMNGNWKTKVVNFELFLRSFLIAFVSAKITYAWSNFKISLVVKFI